MASPDLTLDYLMIDFLQSVSFYSRVNDTTLASPVTVNNCLIDNEVKESLNDGNSEFAYRTSYWTMWTHELGALVPKKGDEFIDAAGQTWNVLNCNDQDKVKCGKYCMQAYTRSLK